LLAVAAAVVVELAESILEPVVVAVKLLLAIIIPLLLVKLSR
jgi:hypothetical protein